MSQNALLHSILQRVHIAASCQKRPVVVFDLDATLFDNGPRTLQILKDFLDATDLTAHQENVAQLHGQQLPYRLHDIAEMAGFDEAMREKAFRFWMERFFTDRYQYFDRPLKGARSFVQKVFAAGATVVYLSGRDAPGMLLGCTEALRRCRFPIGVPRTLLLLKPSFEMGDAAFKESALDFISGLGQVIASFDNEPYNCNVFALKWPKALSVCLDTNCAPHAPALEPACVQIADFQH